MRDIRFRCWYNKEWTFDRKQTMEEISFYELLDCGVADDIDYFHWMQYTGLDDKNGKPIFEGDILKWHKDDTQISATVFHEFAFYHLFDGIHEDFCFDDGKLCEVIGNVHENPELLDKQT